MKSIILFGIDKEDMVEVRENLEKRLKDSKTVPCIRNSHHFIPQSASQIGHKLCSEDDSFVEIHVFKTPAPVDIGDITSLACTTCWVGQFGEQS